MRKYDGTFIITKGLLLIANERNVNNGRFEIFYITTLHNALFLIHETSLNEINLEFSRLSSFFEWNALYLTYVSHTYGDKLTN